MTSSTLARPARAWVTSRDGAATQLGRHVRDAGARAGQAAAATVATRPTRSVPRRARERIVRAHHVLARAAGTALTAAAVTAALSSTEITEGTVTTALLAEQSIRGVAAATVLATAWAFQDRRVMGLHRTIRCWMAAAAGVGVAHATWLCLASAATATSLQSRTATSVAALVLDTLLVAVPALLGCRAAAAPARTT